MSDHAGTRACPGHPGLGRIGVGDQLPAGSGRASKGHFYVISRSDLAKCGAGMSSHKDRKIQKEEQICE